MTKEEFINAVRIADLENVKHVTCKISDLVEIVNELQAVEKVLEVTLRELELADMIAKCKLLEPQIKSLDFYV